MMEIRSTTIKLRSAGLGEDNKYPEFSFQKKNIEIFPDKNLKESDLKGMFIEGKQICMPYTPQANYNRKREEKDVSAIVIENEYLKGTFYPEYGGRLASLVDKKTDRELLFKNSVFQPANLAIRNAWFSGGVEWNGPIYGHNLLTCSPVYFTKCKTAEGKDFLRLYEFDRVTSTTWQVDFYLEGPRLWYSCRAINPENIEKRYYWWTNIAVAIEEDTRVFGSTSDEVTHHNQYQEVLRSAWPKYAGFDASYPQNFPTSNGLFFDTLNYEKPWIATCNKDGSGIMHASTKNLVGRKFFVWGTHQGGRRWENFLSETGKGAYLEIQAGITPTQVQTTEFPVKSSIAWTECICALGADAEKAHNSDWRKANDHIQSHIDRMISVEEIHKKDSEFSENYDCEPTEILTTGSTWGRIFEKAHGQLISQGLNFSSKASVQEQVWLDFLESKEMKEKDPESEKDYVCSDAWVEILNAGKENYLTLLHKGVAALEKENFDEAKSFFEASIELCPTSFSHRNLALIYKQGGDVIQALEQYYKAFELSKENEELCVELVTFLKETQSLSACKNFLEKLEQPLEELHERLQLIRAEIFIEEGNFDKAEELIMNREYATIREGEVALTDMWFAIKKEKGERLEQTPPEKIDFRVV